jgi:cyclopropane fatty-acyl-phospholipid synthase-like methyltransferase
MKTSWDEIYLKIEKERKILKPHSDLKEIAKFFKREKVKKILDLGCGNGRNLIFLAKKDFEVYGIDYSKIALKFLKEGLKEEGLKAKLKLFNIFKKLPYKDNFFDALISIRVIHHQRLKEIKKLMREIERVLKTGGLFFGTVLAREKIPKERLSQLKFIDKRTYFILEGPEKGLYHFHFNRKILKNLLKNFKILKVWKDCENYLAFLARLKI